MSRETRTWRKKISEVEGKQFRKIPKETLQKLFDHSRWLASEGRVGVRLEENHLNLEGLELDGFDFSGARIPAARFNRSTLRFSRFLDTDLTEAEFMYCAADLADYRGANLSGAMFLDTEYEGARFDNANIDGVCWNDGDLDPGIEP